MGTSSHTNIDEGKVNGPPLRTKGNLPSLLPAGYRYLLLVALVFAAFMLANAIYLLANRLSDLAGWEFFAVGKTALPKFFQVMVLTHTGIGLILAVLMVLFFVMHLPVVWQRHHPSSVVSGTLFVFVGLTLVLTGLFILTEAASRDNRWAWWAHVICAGILPLGYAAHRMLGYTRPERGRLKRFVLATASIVVVLLVLHGLSGRGRQSAGRFDRASSTHDAPGSEFLPAGFVPAGSPFFPSAATTSSSARISVSVITGTGEISQEDVRREVTEYGHARETRIGVETCDRCHQDIVAQWAASAHRFASFNNPFYEATVDDLRDNASESNSWIAAHTEQFPETAGEVGKTKSQFCGGCHDPALMLSGRMQRDIDRESVAAQAGLTCLACHVIDTIHNRAGNANYNIADEQEDPYLFASARDGSLAAFLHDAALKAKPTVHKRQMLRPFFRQSEYCATCHKVSLTEPVNNYRWLRGQDEFDNWDDSGVSLNASRTFYLPAVRRVCQDCHMPPEPAVRGDLAAKNGLVRSHRFVAANTALPFIRGDEEMLRRIEAFLRDEKLSVDIFALRREDSPPEMALDGNRQTVVPGDRVTVDVVGRNRGVGHTFPGGTNDSNEGWLEFSVADSDGNTLVVSGQLDHGLQLDSMAHVYTAVMVDKHGRRISKRNGQDIHTTVFANVINPGTADVAHFEFTVPQWLEGQDLTLRARLMWRKFNRDYTVFAYTNNREGFKQFDDVPKLPVTEIAVDSVLLRVGSSDDVHGRTAFTGDPGEWVRYNDYGIGSLLEGNTRVAAVAFAEVRRLQPDRIGGPLNLAKAAIRDGNIERAYQYLRESEAVDPGNPQAAWVWGVVRQEDGRYGEAILAYQHVLEVFPGDRAAWRNMGRSYYLDAQYEEALRAFDRVLEIDPEDRISHYHKMLCFRALGRADEADVSAAAYSYYSIDESAQEVTQEFRLRHPGVNLMAQPIRTHVLVLQRNRGATDRPQ